MNTNTTQEVQEVFKVLVIDNRVRLYRGKDIVSYEECSNHKIALEVAAKIQKEYNAIATSYGPQISDEKRRHLDYVAKVHTAEKVAKKAAKNKAKNKEQIDAEVVELQKQLALLGE